MTDSLYRDDEGNEIPGVRERVAEMAASITGTLKGVENRGSREEKEIYHGFLSAMDVAEEIERESRRRAAEEK